MVRELLRYVVILVVISSLVTGCQAVDNSNAIKATPLMQNEYLMNLVVGIPTLLIGILIMKYLTKRSKDRRSK